MRALAGLPGAALVAGGLALGAAGAGLVGPSGAASSGAAGTYAGGQGGGGATAAGSPGTIAAAGTSMAAVTSPLAGADDAAVPIVIYPAIVNAPAEMQPVSVASAAPVETNGPASPQPGVPSPQVATPAPSPVVHDTTAGTPVNVPEPGGMGWIGFAAVGVALLWTRSATRSR